MSRSTARRRLMTAVYTNVDGKYEFPRLKPGMYTLRIAQPREFQPFVKKDVAINGSPALDDSCLHECGRQVRIPEAQTRYVHAAHRAAARIPAFREEGCRDQRLAGA